MRMLRARGLTKARWRRPRSSTAWAREPARRGASSRSIRAISASNQANSVRPGSDLLPQSSAAPMRGCRSSPSSTKAPDDLFVVRVAGNGLGADALGSLKYAVDHLGESLKLIVVLGHSGCGAVSAAADVLLNPQAYLSLAAKHSLRSVLDRLLVVVHAAAKRLAAVHGPEVTRRPGYREALIEVGVVSNAALAAYTVEQEIGTWAPGGLRAAYGAYLLADRRIWAPRADDAATSGLGYPPPEGAAFDRFADAVVRSERIVRLLGQRGDQA
jgi:carbonic anhydrase